MNALLVACQLLPLLGFLAILALGSTERTIAAVSFWTTQAMGVCTAALLTIWISRGAPNHEFLWFSLFSEGEYQFPILFFLDKVGAAYLLCTWVIFSAIVRYCRVYLHREAGYKRFFLTIFAFAFGLHLVILSGLLDLLFAGWEIVGIASFLLIAFYRHRVQPVRNALRTYSIYRTCDIGLLLAAWLCDLLLQGGNHFSAFAHISTEGASANDWALFALSWCLIYAACGKSAQFPFCFWLPRAMEGPTPSSAIFYGALSVHLGVFLLLRTEPIWGSEWLPRLIIFTAGGASVVVAAISEKAQSSIKGQIAYASIVQVGFMFMELAAGLDNLVLVHFLGNAFLRCYQLLVSPSIVAQLLRIEGAADAGFIMQGRPMVSSLPRPLRDTLPAVLENTLQVLALQEFNLENMVRSTLWTPLIEAGKAINAVSAWKKLLLAAGVASLCWYGLEYGVVTRQTLAFPAVAAMIVTSLVAFSRRRSAFGVWNDVGLSCLLAACTAWFGSETASRDIELFLLGVLPSWLVGLTVLWLMLRNERYGDTPFLYRAMAERRPMLSLLLFLSFLGMAGFPITPAFLGEDLLLFQVSLQHGWMIPLIAASLVLNGIALAGMFLRLSMGRPVEMAEAGADCIALQAFPPASPRAARERS